MKGTRFVKKITMLAIILILPVSLWAFDYGLVTNIYTGFDGAEKNVFEFKADILPRISFLLGDNGGLFISAGLAIDKKDKGAAVIPELLRTEFTWRFGNSGIKIGRMNYSDPLGFIVNGLFDGFQYIYNSSSGRFSFGAWYTGLLYKGNAEIAMTPNDQALLASPLDYSHFADTYFAPKRIIAAFEWNHPSAGELMLLNAAAVIQADLAKTNKYRNQYVILKAGIPVKSFIFEFGGSAEFSQKDNQFGAALAGVLDFTWMLPANIISKLSFNGKIAGGKIEGSLEAFNPVSTRYMGNVFKHKITGLTVLGVDYSARLIDSLGLSVNASYFIRNDLGTFTSYPVNSKDSGHFLGSEIFARIIWSPLSDLQLNLGGGAFFPVMGNAGPKEKIHWRAELTLILALL